MDGSLFFPIGGALIILALILSALGIRGRDKFPPSRPVLIGGSVVFAVAVACTAALAAVNASHEKEERDEELAEEQEYAEAEQPVPPPEGGTPAEELPAEKSPAAGGAPVAQGAETALDVTSPEDGGLSFEPNALEAPPGTVTISYDNPSPVAHNINVEGDGGVLESSEDVTDGAVELTAQLQPGAYVFFCSLPGHREGGMEGDLLVQ
jgi:plastocyanin